MERYSIFLGKKNQYCENEYSTKWIYRFNVIPIKLSMTFFRELEQKFSQFIWKHKIPQIEKVVLWNNNGAEESTSLTSDYTTKLQSSRQYGTDTKPVK